MIDRFAGRRQERFGKVSGKSRVSGFRWEKGIQNPGARIQNISGCDDGSEAGLNF
jgi:hypothetical protein